MKDSEWGIGDRICVRSSPGVLLVLRVTDTTSGQDASMASLAELWKRQ
ncbi:hypothetical protein [Streptomyces erythrochromogenes]